MSGEAELRVESVAATASHATFSVGSRLLAVRDGLPNALLGALLGGNIELSVMDYQALVSADVTLADQIDALATRLNVTAGTYQDVLTTDATVGDWLAAMADVTSGSDGTAGAALRTMAARSDATSMNLPLEKVVNLGAFATTAIGTQSKGLTATFSALELVTAAAQIANFERQIDIDLALNVPNVARARLQLAVGEPPQYVAWAVAGGPETEVYTAQTRLRLVIELAGGSGMSGSLVRLPLYVDLASARARLNGVACEQGSASQASASVAVRPGVVSAWIGEPSASWNDFDARPYVGAADIVDLALLKVRGRAFVEATNVNESTLEFSASDIESQRLKRVDTTDIAETLVSTLVGQLRLHAQVGGLTLGVPPLVSSQISNLLSEVARPLDEVVASTIEILGIHLGEADVRVHGAACGSAVLAG